MTSKILHVVLILLFSTAGVRAQTKDEPVEKLGENLFRVGNIRVDVAKREVTIPAKVNDATALEFIANTRGGLKAYESALEVNTSAVLFNTALILIGLDKTKGVPTKVHFDPTPPKGDPVEIWVEWNANGVQRKVPAEELIWNYETKKTLPAGQWVYTGSSILEDGRYLAELDGVLIGFVHTPAPVIERTSFEQVQYGFLRLNSSLGLTPGTAVTLTVKALPKTD
jgi:hypothetical protein